MYLLNKLVGGMNPTTILVYLKSPFICIFAYSFSIAKSRLRTPHSLVYHVIHNCVSPLLEYI